MTKPSRDQVFRQNVRNHEAARVLLIEGSDMIRKAREKVLGFMPDYRQEEAKDCFDDVMVHIKTLLEFLEECPL